MKLWNKILTAVKGSEDFSEIKSSTFRDLLNGSILSKNFLLKQYKLFAMIVVLLIFYINNRYNSEVLIAEEVKLKKELQDVKFESLTISAELTKLGRRTYVLNLINARGIDLKESPISPIEIKEPDPKKDEEILKAKGEQNAASEKIKKDTTTNEEIIEL